MGCGCVQVVFMWLGVVCGCVCVVFVWLCEGFVCRGVYVGGVVHVWVVWVVLGVLCLCAEGLCVGEVVCVALWGEYCM